MDQEVPPDEHVERSGGSWLESLRISMGFAMPLALLFVATVGYRALIAHDFVAASRDVAWMAPISAALCFAIILLPVIALSPFMRHDFAPRVAIFASAWLFVFALLLPWTQIHRAAAAILAAGVAATCVRAFTTATRRRWLDRAALASLGILLVAAAVTGVYNVRRERAAIRSRPAARAGAPNVLLIILDTVRASALSLYGYSRPTSPELEAFASRGMVIDRAFSTAPWTLPSHGTMFTGEYPGDLSTTFKSRLDGRNHTLAEAFRDAGYETIGITGNLQYTAWDSGLSRGFVHYLDFRRSFRQIVRSGWIGESGLVRGLLEARSLGMVANTLLRPRLSVHPKPGGDGRDAVDLANDLLAWHAAHQNRPFFAFINFFDAHEDYRPPKDLRTRFAPHPTERDLYDAEIVHIDRNLGRLLRELEQRGTLANTLVIIAGDHGEQFGEHGRRGHGNSLYTQLLHVPLVVRFDGRLPAGRHEATPISLRDLAATINDVTGLADPVGFPGHSLVPLWRGDSSAPRSPIISELTQEPLPPSTDVLRRSQLLSLIDEGHHFIRRNLRDIDELYDVRADLDETRNLAGASESASMLTTLRQRLRSALSADSRGHQTVVH